MRITLSVLLVMAMFSSFSKAAESVPEVQGTLTVETIDDSASFEKTVIDKTFRSEGVAVADVNHDGKPDVLAGEVWYEAPNWTMHEIADPGEYVFDKGYSKVFGAFSGDVNRDGWDDFIITTMMGEPCWWFENPKNKPGHWQKHMATVSATNESPKVISVEDKQSGDKVPVLVCGVQPGGYMAWFTPGDDPYAEWEKHIIAGPDAPGSERYGHGIGVGDVNGDDRLDLIVTAGWWEQPEDPTQENWTFHKADLGPDSTDMLVMDVDEDGDSDIIGSSAHRFGLWWFEQKPGDDGSAETQFVRHMICDDFSQVHALQLLDMNGDGKLDFVTGKRFYAHNGKDPGADMPAVLYWFEAKVNDDGTFRFVRHLIDGDWGVGNQFTTGDINRNGKPDVVVSNKKGTAIFVQ